MLIVDILMAGLRSAQSKWLLFGKSSFLTYWIGVHVGKGTRLWAPTALRIGTHVYIGKPVHIEANCAIGDYCLIANRVAIIGRNDHDYTAVSFSMRYAPWIGSKRFLSPHKENKVVNEPDVWLGFGAVVFAGLTIGCGSVTAADSVVTKDSPPYSIAAGVPAKVVVRCFSSALTLQQYGLAIRTRDFQFSERGDDFCVIEPSVKEAA